MYLQMYVNIPAPWILWEIMGKEKTESQTNMGFLRFGIVVTKNLKCTVLKTKEYFSWKLMVVEDEMAFWKWSHFGGHSFIFGGIHFFLEGKGWGKDGFSPLATPKIDETPYTDVIRWAPTNGVK